MINPTLRSRHSNGVAESPIGAGRSGGLMRTVSRVVAVLAALIGVAMVAPSPARADALACRTLGGSGDVTAEVCLEDDYYQGPCCRGVKLGSWVVFRPGFTSTANDCRVTMRAELSSGSSVWSTGSTVRNCDYATARPGFYSLNDHLSTDTQATVINTVACVDLYGPGGTTAFWHRCTSSGWHDLNFDYVIMH
ncbi:hypothetical protein AB0M02_04055 [Actinoplanes sp. NPDC051861]|uniref:hypothetical protein n=1 Tax=Actinoplanes sp. NPDC051861 TaxID=3155170 RepID=UPI0034387DE2